ncbi:MAG TPA: hypothetical protein ENG81_03820 [Candidatus Bathyarchaeota archaeon]|nr:hypothetical protein [Candidatus Bathyarchaeota archaeon]
MKYIIGIDGGGSKTEAVSTTLKGKLIKTGREGSININIVGVEEAYENLRRVIEKVKLNGKAEICVLGAAGVEKRENMKHLYEKCMELDFSEKLIITSDAKIALESILDGEKIIVISGTGSIALAEDKSGETIRAGGWGYILDDEGSGFWIGLKALREVLREYDGRSERSKLTPLILEKYGLNEAKLLVDIFYSGKLKVQNIANITKLVAEAEEMGDEKAHRIFLEAGRNLAEMALAIIRKVNWRKPKIYCFGGVFNATDTILQAMRKEIIKVKPEVKVEKSNIKPIAGTVILALKKLRVKINREIYQNILQWSRVENGR